MLICKITEDSSAMLDYNAEDMVKLKALSDKMSFEKISHATSVLSDAQADTKWMKSPRIVYELALYKTCHDPNMTIHRQRLWTGLRHWKTKLKTVPLPILLPYPKEFQILRKR